ncbi:SemiSWEET family transporter [Candidatus Actinomarina]|nr:SemiSWEET family transporter [Candidatus Actinomarina sp.]
MGFEVVGYIATFFSAISAAPQAFKTIRTRDIKGLSIGMWLLSLAASFSWLSYGIYLMDFPLIITNVMTTSFQTIILYIIFQEKVK